MVILGVVVEFEVYGLIEEFGWDVCCSGCFVVVNFVD